MLPAEHNLLGQLQGGVDGQLLLLLLLQCLPSSGGGHLLCLLRLQLHLLDVLLLLDEGSRRRDRLLLRPFERLLPLPMHHLRSDGHVALCLEQRGLLLCLLG